MDEQPAKPMKKAHRNLFHKMGKGLEKLEQKLGVPSPNLPHGYASTGDLSAISRQSEYDEEDDEQDAVSLQYHANDPASTPRAVLRHKRGMPTVREVNDDDLHAI